MSFKSKLTKCQPVTGTWFTIPSSHLCDVIASSGLDFMILDREHGPLNFETIQTLVSVAKSRNVAFWLPLGKLFEFILATDPNSLRTQNPECAA